MPTVFARKGLAGGTPGYLDALDGDQLAHDDLSLAYWLGRLDFFRLNDVSGASETIPNIIAPDVNPGTKRWERLFQYLLGNSPETELTITSGSVTAMSCLHRLATEGGGATDDLTNIVTTNAPDGTLLLLRTSSSAMAVTVKHKAGGAGQIHLRSNEDQIITDTKTMFLIRRGADWHELVIAFSPEIDTLINTVNVTNHALFR